jgi:hypothetical protein
VNKKLVLLSAFLIVALLVVSFAALLPKQAKADTLATPIAVVNQKTDLTLTQYSIIASDMYVLGLRTQVLSLKLDQAVLSMKNEITAFEQHPIVNPTPNEAAAEAVEVTQIGVRLNYLSGLANSLNQIKTSENAIYANVL